VQKSRCDIAARAKSHWPNCLVPECGGISQADPAFREGLWARYFTAAPRPRTPSELRYSDRRELAARYGLNHKTVACPTARYRLHMFDRLCREHGIEHRLTKPNQNRTLKEATVRRYHYETHAQLRDHLEAFLNAHNFAKRLKTLRGLTPYEHICKAWADQPTRFRYDPTHLTSGLNSWLMKPRARRSRLYSTRAAARWRGSRRVRQ
jgi:hypothetical protein